MLDRFHKFSVSIFEISRLWHKIAGEEMEKFGLKGPHAIYLMLLQQSPDGLTAAQLCELCGRDKADLSRAVTLMEQKGIVSRADGNGYRAAIYLTENGKKAAQQVADRAAVAVELAGKDMTESDRDTFYASLTSITENLRQLSKSGLPKERETICP